MMSKLRRFFAPNRVAVYLTVGAGAAGAAAVPLTGADTTTTVGIVVAYAGAVQAVVKWLDGWQRYEASQRGDFTGGVPPLPKPDEA
jgi:hypothetical protein